MKSFPKYVNHICLLTGCLTAMLLSMAACHPENGDPLPGTDPVIPNDTLLFPIFGTDTLPLVMTDARTVFVNFHPDQDADVDNPDSSRVRFRQEGNRLSAEILDKDVVIYLRGSSEKARFSVSGQEDFCLVTEDLQLSNRLDARAGEDLFSLRCEGLCLMAVIGSNRLEDAGSPADSAHACLYSRGRLAVTGGGELRLASASRHGISAKAGLVSQQTRILIESGKDGIHSDGDIRLAHQEILITTQDDAVQSENGQILLDSVTLTSAVTARKSCGLDALQSVSLIGGSSLSMRLEGEAAKGIRTGGNICLIDSRVDIESHSGSFYDETAQDISSSSCLKSGGSIAIGGTRTQVLLKAFGRAGKCMNADGNILITDGYVETLTEGNIHRLDNGISASAKAIKAEGLFSLSGGQLLVRTSGGEGSDGIRCRDNLFLSGGQLDVDASDDALKSDAIISLSGGTLHAVSHQNDALDGTGGIYVSGGQHTVYGADIDKKGGLETEGAVKLTGGTLLAVGNKNSKPSAVVSTQCCACLTLGRTVGKGQSVSVGQEERTLFSVELPLTYNSRMQLVFSSPELLRDESYKLFTDGQPVLEFTQNAIVVSAK